MSRPTRDAAGMAWLRSRRKWLPKPVHKAPVTLGSRTRFSRQRESGGKHSTELIRLEVVKRYRAGEKVKAIARVLGIHLKSVKNWTSTSKLSVKPTSLYTLPKMLALVTLARNLYRQKFSPVPIHCLWEAVRLTPPTKKSSMRVYLSLEAIPALAGFPLYADPAVQARCEALGRGERTRGCDLFDEPGVALPPTPLPPSVPAPNAPAATPPATRPGFDREKFLAGRSRLGLPRLQP